MDCIKLEKDSSLVRVFHASPELPPVDVYVNDKLLFQNIKFKDFSKYIQIKEDNYKLDIFESGDQQSPLINQTVKVDSKEVYTIAIIGSMDNLSLLVINDYSSKTINDDYSSFRMINLSPQSQPIDIIVDGDTLFKNIGYKEGTIYADVKISEYNIKLTSSIDNATLAKFKSKFKANRIYTIYLVGNPKSLSIIQSVDGNTHLCR